MTNPESKPQGEESTEPKLSRRQMLTLRIIAAASNLTQTARDAGISRATLLRWRQDEYFWTEMDRMPHEIAETTREGLRDLIIDGMEKIKKLTQDPDVPRQAFLPADLIVVNHPTQW